MLIVTLPPTAAGDPAGFTRTARAAGAQAVEIRGDLTGGLLPFASALPLVLAPRGGDLVALLARGAALVDQELHEPRLSCPGARRIASFHDHVGTPNVERLVEVGTDLRAGGADLVKLATLATCARDLEVLAEVRAELARGGPTTVLAMGPWAELDRVRSPWHNASTYAALDHDWCAAPGQLTVARHLELAGDEPPTTYGVLGGPQFVARSASPRLFERLFERHGLRAAYVRFPSSAVDADLAALRRLGVSGLSVTAPHKLAAAAFAERQSDETRRAGSANTLVLGEVVVAHQFDALGIVDGYPELAGLGPVAIVGSGGVVPAVLLAAERLGWKDVSIYARNADAAGALAARFGVTALPLGALASAQPTLLVWALPSDPLGILPAARKGAVALDLRYVGTPFQERARQLGYIVRDGAAMLVHQALAQFTTFTGRTPLPGDAVALAELLA